MISGVISADDFLAAHRLHRKPLVRRQFLILGAFILIGLLAIWAGYLFPGIVGICAGVGGFIGEFLASRYFMPRKQLRIFRQQAAFRYLHSYAWDADRLSGMTEVGQSARPWKDYVKATEDERMFLLYHSDVMFEMFPKSWFQGPEQVEEFRRLAFRAGA